jgi:hypothetical protein
MNNKQKEKLELIIAKRMNRIESLNFFGQYFEEFAYSVLKKAIYVINARLEGITAENLRIFYENPYENKRNRFFVMVQLFSNTYNNNQRSNFLLDYTQAFPSLLFEGDEFTGKVLSSIKFENKINLVREIEITKLKDEDTVNEILIDFLDKIYSL